MKLLDLFCGAGGAAMGYYHAGFTEIVGVDIKTQKNYPFEFVLGDALEYAIKNGHKFDVIHASPPCQAYSVTRSLHNNKHPELVEPTREILRRLDKPYVIENVPGAPLENPIRLCGTMFNLRVIRHRLFETEPVIWFPPAQCKHIGNASGTKNYKIIGTGKRNLENFRYLTVAGSSYNKDDGKIAMGINWMKPKELNQAIPPAYTKWLGGQIIKELQ